MEISIKNGDNIQELIKKINEAVNENKNELPSNIVSEAVEKKANLMKYGIQQVKKDSDVYQKNIIKMPMVFYYYSMSLSKRLSLVFPTG